MASFGSASGLQRKQTPQNGTLNRRLKTIGTGTCLVRCQMEQTDLQEMEQKFPQYTSLRSYVKAIIR